MGAYKNILNKRAGGLKFASKPPPKITRAPARKPTGPVGSPHAKHDGTLPFQSRSRPPPPPSDSMPHERAQRARRNMNLRKIPLVLAGVTAAGMGFYCVGILRSLYGDQEHRNVPADVSNRYDERAAQYDKEVDGAEYWLGITKRRRDLAGRVKGHILEVSVGTGRNIAYYPTKQCESVTLLDKSLPMLLEAKMKWKDQHPEFFRKAYFKRQSALDPIAPPQDSPEGYDTVVQTMGLCSTPEPVALLQNIETVTKEDGRILLLEHGKSHYAWLNDIMERTAPAHADKHGCWWNKDIGKIVEDSGLEVVNMKRYNFGTTWWLELKPRKGRNRAATISLAAAAAQKVKSEADHPAAGQIVTQKSWWSLWS